MFQAVYVSENGKTCPVNVYQILLNRSFRGGYGAVVYDFKRKEWIILDLDKIHPVLQ